MNISATIITLNEEPNIEECLKSIDWASEVVVVDSGSSDRTEEICRSFSQVVFYSRQWEGFGRQKNMAAEFAVNDWIFNIDADERVSPQLRASILSADTANFSGYRVARENYFGNRRIRHCGWYPDYNLRLYDRRKSRFSAREVHESVTCDGPVGTLTGNLIHYSYRDIGDYLRRMDRYSTLAARQLISEGKLPGMLSVVVRPLLTFLKMYLLKRGILDGYAGFVVSSLYAFYTFSKYAKSLEMRREGFIPPES